METQAIDQVYEFIDYLNYGIESEFSDSQEVEKLCEMYVSTVQQLSKEQK